MELGIEDFDALRHYLTIQGQHRGHSWREGNLDVHPENGGEDFDVNINRA
jgi:hypothetical protein